MDEQLLNDLLISLKNSLRITWDEEDIHLKILITRTKKYLEELTGTILDLSIEDQPKTLLIERCRYVYNNVADEFEKNYQHELSRLILREAVKAGETVETTI